MDTFESVDVNNSNDDERKKAIASLTFLAGKRDRPIKAHACADGCKQRKCTDKIETASPTAMMESIFVTTTINSKEQRDVATIDLPGAFLHARNDKMLSCFERKMAELMVHAAPQIHRKYIATTKHG